MLACEKILGHSNFRNYTYTLKEDMKSHAVWRVIQNLKNFKKEMSSTKFFNYLTTCIFCAYIQVIKQYYKDLKL